MGSTSSPPCSQPCSVRTTQNDQTVSSSTAPNSSPVAIAYYYWTHIGRESNPIDTASCCLFTRHRYWRSTFFLFVCRHHRDRLLCWWPEIKHMPRTTFRTGSDALPIPLPNSWVGSGIAATMLTCIADCADCDCVPTSYPTEEAYSGTTDISGNGDEVARVEAVRKRDDERKYNANRPTTTEALERQAELMFAATSSREQTSSTKQVRYLGVSD